MTPQNIETLLEAKETFSSEGGYFKESHAPLIGGPKHLIGRMVRLDEPKWSSSDEWHDRFGEIKGMNKFIYLLHNIMIDDDNDIKVYLFSDSMSHPDKVEVDLISSESSIQASTRSAFYELQKELWAEL